MGKKLICLCIFFVQYLTSQTLEIEAIDNKLWNYSTQLLNNGEYEELISLNQSLIKKCKNIGYQEGIIVGYCNLSFVSCKLGNYKQSISFIELAKKENESFDNKGALAIIEATKGFAYYSLEQHRRSINDLKKSIELSVNLPSKNKQQKIKSLCYKELIANYDRLENFDSAFYYSKRAFEDLHGVFESGALAFSYYKYKNDLNSAKFYLKYAEKKAKTVKSSKFDLYVLNRVWGEYYESQRQYDSARIYYNKILKIGEELRSPILTRDAYWFLFNIDELTNNKEGLSKNLLQYTELSDCIEKLRQRQAEIPIQQYIKDNESEYTQKKNKFRATIIIIIALGFITVSIILYVNRKKQNHLDLQIKEKEDTIVQKDDEVQNLRKKLQDELEEIILLAKDNSPELTSRFIELYPDFYASLKRIDPKINTETLKFCIFLKLNFSTKEIAEYIFITPRAVQIRKNRLRKKFNIPSNEDLYNWINNRT